VTPGEQLPAGFEWAREGRLVIALRSDVRELLLPLVQQWAESRLPAGRPLAGGRGGAAAFDLSAGLSVVLRPCRRGGLVSRVNREIYFGWRPRPWRELVVTEALRSRGVATVEMLGAGVRWRGPLWYRGAVVSREIPAALNLWRHLETVAPAARVRACERAAAVIRRMHDAGVVHPDLNLQNFLVREDKVGSEVLVIDLDRARLAPARKADREAAFLRLQRSVRRLDPQRRIVTSECLTALRAIGEVG